MNSSNSDHIGKSIKEYRKKARMTQKELSKGIISNSYLSKIENGTISTSSEIIETLTNRLEIEPLQVNSNLITLCSTWFTQLLQRDIADAEKNLSEILKNIDLIESMGLRNLVEIHKLSYYIQIGDTKKTKILFNELKVLSSNFNDREKYYWLKFSGDYYFYLENYERAHMYYINAKELTNSFDIDLEEKNDLFYVISLTANKARNTYLCLQYAEKSLVYFKKYYKLKRAAECHILLGISYQRVCDYNQAKENFELALIIGNITNSEYILKLCHQNLGKLAALTNEFNKAVHHYTVKLSLCNESSYVEQLISISSLMKLYYGKGDIENATYWLDKGAFLSKDIDPTDSLYVYEFQVYNYLIKGVDNSFEELITKEIIPYLDDKRLLYEKYTYLSILANYYFDNRKYKLSAITYNYALNVLTKSKKLQGE